MPKTKGDARLLALQARTGSLAGDNSREYLEELRLQLLNWGSRVEEEIAMLDVREKAEAGRARR